MRIGVDAGGTFTDFVVLHDDGRLESFKLRSNPRAPARVILEGLRRAAGEEPAEVVHGSTVATNALLERKGARAALVTTAGFEDLIAIGRQNRAELYNLTPGPKRPLVDRALCFGVRERTHFDGTVARRPRASELRALREKLRRAKVDSVAICFLHAYRNLANERLAAEALDGFRVSCSYDVCPEFREYERASTTLLNAYVGPLMDAYLAELEAGLPRPVAILQSNGGFMTAAEARRHPVRTILSGPAGGVSGAIEMARLSGFERILGFDMGGTSTDVSLSDGRARETTEASIDGFPVRVPMLDIHTVGAGGGSIARVDEGGLLRVGPESAGADPGPACYGLGEEPTVTDAHVVLGRIAADQFLGGQMRIDVDRAGAAVDRVASRLGLSRTAAAEGILRVANANMERAIRVVSVERGHDPRDFVLAAFGGCGGLHACEIADDLGIRVVLVPRYAGALSALGMLLADRVRDYAAGVLGCGDVEERFRELEARALSDAPEANLERTADLRYAGQSYELNVPWSSAGAGAAFHDEHQRTYGYSNPDRAVEVVTIRVRARVAVPRPSFPALERSPAVHSETRRARVAGRWRRVPVLRREQTPARGRPGPALVLDYGATTLVPPGWAASVDNIGNLVLRREGVEPTL
jgi:N-methylhydantoinase A/oxoprolinase/acetone carboxylase beta subunit